jgi:hypothetical protein
MLYNHHWAGGRSGRHGSARLCKGGPVSDDMHPVTGEWLGPSGSFADSRADSGPHQGLRAAGPARLYGRPSPEWVAAIKGRRRSPVSRLSRGGFPQPPSQTAAAATDGSMRAALVMTRRGCRTVCLRLGLAIPRVLLPLRWCRRPTGLRQPLIDRARTDQHPHATAPQRPSDARRPVR